MRSARLAVVLLLCAGIVRADDPSERAKQLYEEGVKRYNLRRLPEALTAFENAYLAKPDPVFLFNIGQCHRMMGHHEEAAYAYRRYLAASPDAQNRKEVENFIAAADEALQRKATVAPPIGTLPPADKPALAPGLAEPPAAPSPEAAAAVTSTPKEALIASESATVAETQDHTTPSSFRRLWWVWTLAGVVVLGAAVGIGVAVAASPAPKFEPTIMEEFKGLTRLSF